MKSKKLPALACPIDAIGASARLMGTYSGFYESHEPPPSGDARGIVLPHRDGHWGTFCIFVSFAVALAAAGVIRSE